jgi:hypothetical protein
MVLTGVVIDVLEVGVSSTGVRVEAGVAVDWGPGKLQEATPRLRAMTAILKQFLIDSSFSIRIVTGRWSGYNSPSVFCFRMADF